ncbi:MAG: hypothetical protein R3192_11525 [Woeseiaceae bacterium]|nr:hypothetical protein [Woeseiaceae bacterium]
MSSIYRADPGYDVTDFLITDPALAKILGQESMIPKAEETVLLKQDDDGLALSLFLDNDMLSRLNGSDPLKDLKANQLDDLWTVLEGISHFNYIAWRARKNRSMSLLELEMQAEVDKFVSTFLMALEQDDAELATRLHGWLFDEVSFNPRLSKDQLERYAIANNYAARFCHGLIDRLSRNSYSALSELRHFYRLSQGDKISHIHAHSLR